MGHRCTLWARVLSQNSLASVIKFTRGAGDCIALLLLRSCNISKARIVVLPRCVHGTTSDIVSMSHAVCIVALGCI